MDNLEQPWLTFKNLKVVPESNYVFDEEPQRSWLNTGQGVMCSSLLMPRMILDANSVLHT